MGNYSQFKKRRADDLNITIFRTLSITLLLCITGPKITLLPVLALIIAQVGTFNIYRNNHIYKSHISFCILQHRKITWLLYFDKLGCYLCIVRCITSIKVKNVYDYSSFSIFLLVVSQCRLMLVYFVFVVLQPETICDKYWENRIIPA